ncbi:uncharacterized protein LOC108623142, partial [Ceratina calcarata]|uniref:Uncharacterized protein LOC108623142 n=1 Tax=Ceratina calcarata TaxID=156304 RepID=A0AAJ7IUG1_9HYME
MASLRRHAHEEYGIKRPILDMYYKAMVENPTIKKELSAIQRAILILVTRACRTISTAAMNVIAEYKPMDLEITSIALARLLKKGKSVFWRDVELPVELDLEVEEKLKRLEERIKTEWQDQWKTDEHGRELYIFIKN